MLHRNTFLWLHYSCEAEVLILYIFIFITLVESKSSRVSTLLVPIRFSVFSCTATRRYKSLFICHSRFKRLFLGSSSIPSRSFIKNNEQILFTCTNNQCSHTVSITFLIYKFVSFYSTWFQDEHWQHCFLIIS